MYIDINTVYYTIVHNITLKNISSYIIFLLCILNARHRLYSVRYTLDIQRDLLTEYVYGYCLLCFIHAIHIIRQMPTTSHHSSLPARCWKTSTVINIPGNRRHYHYRSFASSRLTTSFLWTKQQVNLLVGWWFFFGMRSCEYLKVIGKKRKTKRLKIRSIRFFKNNVERRDKTCIMIRLFADMVSITFEFQKINKRKQL